MKNLQEATEMICDLKGSVLALDTLLTALLRDVSDETRASLLSRLTESAEIGRTVLLHTPISEHTIAGFERDIGRFASLIKAQ